MNGVMRGIAMLCGGFDTYLWRSVAIDVVGGGFVYFRLRSGSNFCISKTGKLKHLLEKKLTTLMGASMHICCPALLPCYEDAYMRSSRCSRRK